MAAVTDVRTSFEVRAAQPLFQTRARINQRYMYDLAPDGQRFLINTLVQTAVQPVTLVINWPALLKN